MYFFMQCQSCAKSTTEDTVCRTMTRESCGLLRRYGYVPWRWLLDNSDEPIKNSKIPPTGTYFYAYYKLGHSVCWLKIWRPDCNWPGCVVRRRGGFNQFGRVVYFHEHPIMLIRNNCHLLLNNPNLKFLLTRSWSSLTAANIPWTTFVHGDVQNINGLSRSGWRNTRPFILTFLLFIILVWLTIDFYPAILYHTHKPVEILALPVCAPWLKMWMLWIMPKR